MPSLSRQAAASSWHSQPLLGKTKLCCCFSLQCRLPSLLPLAWGSCPQAGCFLAPLGGRDRHTHPTQAPGTRTRAPRLAVAIQRHLLGLLETLPCGSWHSGSESRCWAGEGGTWARGTGHRSPPRTPCSPGGCAVVAQGTKPGRPHEWHLPQLGHSPMPPARSAAPAAVEAPRSVSQQLLFYATASGREGAALARQLLQRWTPRVPPCGGTWQKKILPTSSEALGISGN